MEQSLKVIGLSKKDKNKYYLIQNSQDYKTALYYYTKRIQFIIHLHVLVCFVIYGYLFSNINKINTNLQFYFLLYGKYLWYCTLYTININTSTSLYMDSTFYYWIYSIVIASYYFEELKNQSLLLFVILNLHIWGYLIALIIEFGYTTYTLNKVYSNPCGKDVIIYFYFVFKVINKEEINKMYKKMYN